MGFGDYLKQLREKRKFTINQLALRAGVSNAHISRMERGLRPAPSPEIIERLAKALNADYEEFMRAAGYLPDKEKSHYPIPGEILIGENAQIPILETIKAGKPILAKENIIGYGNIPKNLADTGEFFFLKVKDDSMMHSRIRSGDMVLAKRQSEVENGQIAVVVVNGEDAALKRVYYGDGILTLQPDNPEYPPQSFTRKQVKDLPVEIIGKVVEVRFKL